MMHGQQNVKHSDVKIICTAVELWRENNFSGIVVKELREDTIFHAQ